MNNARLERIAVRISGLVQSSTDYENSLDDYVGKLDEAKKLLENIHEKTVSPPGKAIIVGMHSDLFNFIADRENGVRKWIAQLKFMSRSKPQKSAS